MLRASVPVPFASVALSRISTSVLPQLGGIVLLGTQEVGFAVEIGTGGPGP
jgi:hypothetical protein